MVEHGKVDRLAGASQLAGRAMVGFARPGVATRMAMGDDYAGASKANRVGKDFADRDVDGRVGPEIMLDMEAAGGPVDMSHKQLLS